MLTRRWIRSKTHSRLLVHTTADDSFEGVLLFEAKDGLVLVGATMHGERPTELSGEVFIPRDVVRMIQLLPPKAAPRNA